METTQNQTPFYGTYSNLTPYPFLSKNVKLFGGTKQRSLNQIRHCLTGHLASFFYQKISKYLINFRN